MTPEYMDRIISARITIEKQWPGVSAMPPISIENGGYASPFSADEYAQAWARGSTYSCAINLLWCNFMRCPLPHVPVYPARVNELLAHVQPGVLKHAVVIRSSWAGGDPTPIGELQHVSPTEFLHAVLLKVADAITSGEDAAVLDSWKKLVLSTTVTFARFDQDEQVMAEAISMREEAAGYRNVVEHTARQLILNVVGVKRRLDIHCYLLLV